MLVVVSLMVYAPPESAPPKRVLLLRHVGRESLAVVFFDQGFEEGMRSAPSGSIELYREALESYRFPGEEHAQLMRKDADMQFVGNLFVGLIVTDQS